MLDLERIQGVTCDGYDGCFQQVVVAVAPNLNPPRRLCGFFFLTFCLGGNKRFGLVFSRFCEANNAC